ncbi:hypothetical protein IQ22_02435 [Pseudomonas duriflava]|uniref:Uncharacterized protein n=1 Tax=Pseudomonas duriflava TaxID=459528 RepID=A0A562QAN3_9PSED|nr:hypothetical protein IQ22_02435 [Pseudomonas duriflava]
MKTLRQLSTRLPKETLPLLANLFDRLGDSANDEETQIFIGWIDQQLSLVQRENLSHAVATDSALRATNFVYLEAWRFLSGSFDPSNGYLWASKGFPEWIRIGAFSPPSWTWRALKGLHFSQGKLKVHFPSSASLH